VIAGPSFDTKDTKDTKFTKGSAPISFGGEAA
jgi:hypothetical protein